jgi:hypothetical protein
MASVERRERKAASVIGKRTDAELGTDAELSSAAPAVAIDAAHKNRE